MKKNTKPILIKISKMPVTNWTTKQKYIEWTLVFLKAGHSTRDATLYHRRYTYFIFFKIMKRRKHITEYKLIINYRGKYGESKRGYVTLNNTRSLKRELIKKGQEIIMRYERR